MTQNRGDVNQGLDYCDVCRRETPHPITIELRTENPTAENAAFSREPYRVATCRICETERSG